MRPPWGKFLSELGAPHSPARWTPENAPSPIGFGGGIFPPAGLWDRVRKRGGNEYPGVIASVFTTLAGAVRYVVEADHLSFAGMLHIYKEEQLEPRECCGANGAATQARRGTVLSTI
jgi:hypothetical protein